jgi:hypothetical protein
MKPIKSVMYVEIDVQTDQVECHVTYIDDTREVFFEDEDLERVKRQLWKQTQPGSRITL